MKLLIHEGIIKRDNWMLSQFLRVAERSAWDTAISCYYLLSGRNCKYCIVRLTEN